MYTHIFKNAQQKERCSKLRTLRYVVFTTTETHPAYICMHVCMGIHTYTYTHTYTYSRMHSRKNDVQSYAHSGMFTTTETHPAYRHTYMYRVYAHIQVNACIKKCI